MNNVLEFAELTTADMGNRKTIRQNTQRGEEVVKIALDKIVIREGFNVRQDYGNLDELAYSILENGQTVPGRVDVLADGTFMLTDGHRRFKALCILADMGNEPLFKAIVNNTKTTEEQRILQMFTTQDAKALAPNEIAELMQRLINLGYKQTDIAKKIGKTPGYVSQMLSYANESLVIKEHVTNGHLNVSTALKLQKAIPVQSERVAAVNKAIVTKKATSKSNKAASITVKDVTGKSSKLDPKELAEAIADMYSIEDKLEPMIKLIKSFM